MRIDRLEVRNFKKFARLTLDLNPTFTLLVGENGAGKTSVLDALAVAMGIWLVRPPDAEVRNSGRKILRSEVRLEPRREGDRVQFRPIPPSSITAVGTLGDKSGVKWTRENYSGRNVTNDQKAQDALRIIEAIYDKDRRGGKVVCPILAYYGAGRAWLPSNKRMAHKIMPNGPARRWAAFYDCFNERIRFNELQNWFSRETIAAGNRAGRLRPGFEAVKKAILQCVPEADEIWFDPDREQIVLSISGSAQPFENLSAGQRMMLALVADIAIKTVTQNAFLLPPDELGPDDTPLPRVLRETPGIVLIDELDVHLHPRWQRRVATDLKATFPSLQFVCTSHSPQVIGELSPEEIRVFGVEGVQPVERSVGLDSNWILRHLMGADERNPALKDRLGSIEGQIAHGEYDEARDALATLRREGWDLPELAVLTTRLDKLEALAQ